MMMQANIHLRLAVPEDVPVLRELIDASVRRLQTEDYTQAQIEGALKTVFGVDSQLIADGTYIVAQAVPAAIERAGAKNAPSERIIVGCGGWSKRKTLYGSDLGRVARMRSWTPFAMRQRFALFSSIPIGRAAESAA